MMAMEEMDGNLYTAIAENKSRLELTSASLADQSAGSHFP